MKNRFMNLPLKFKVTLTNFITVLFVAVFLTLFFYNLYVKNMVSQIGAYQAQNTEFISNDLGLIEDSIVSLSTNLIIDQNFQNMLHMPRFSLTPFSEVVSDVHSSINIGLSTLASNDYVNDIGVYTTNGYDFYYSKSSPNPGLQFSSAKATAPVRAALQLSGEPCWSSLSARDERVLIGSSDSKLTLLKGIMDLNDLKVKGVLIIGVKWDVLWSHVPKSDNYLYLVADADGNIVSHANSYADREAPSGNLKAYLPGWSAVPNRSVVTMGGEKYLFTRSGIAGGSYSIVSLLPLNTALRSVRSVMPSLLFLFSTCLVFSLLLSFYLSSLVTKPLHKLVEAFHFAKRGDLKKKVDFVYHDEIGILGSEYNKMIDDLNRLFNRVLRLEIRNRESEIKALQAKINPHFLYNTLDSIYLKAVQSGNDDVAEMIYSLSHIFRLTLNRGSDSIAIRDEKSLIENYLALQKIRFKDRLDYEVRFDESILPLQIPKLILQPFVENSITHGMENSSRPVFVKVEGREDGDSLSFTVGDNGGGIPPETLRRILRGSERDGSSPGYAIRNVLERLRLYFGEGQHFEISSREAEGTVVSIRIEKRALQELRHPGPGAMEPES